MPPLAPDRSPAGFPSAPRPRKRAAQAGGRYACPSAVIRPDDHPLGLAAFRPIEGLVAAFPWKDLGDSIETAKPMPFWMREL